MMSSTKRLCGAIATSVVALNLGGCVVAAIPMLMAAGVGVVAMAGFAVFKTVQTTGGGTMQIAFESSDCKRASPPAALPALTTVAVWPVGERERKFSETLSTSGKFHMVRLDNSPAPPSSDAERSRGFAAQCKQSKVDMIFAAIDLGQTVKSNLMSFKRGSVADKL